ncbi:MAG TPA: 1-deoxy-D-xylulose-5-phosphate synthase N-terminal domain-containing protein [Candidatus Sulfotelmatobacter sp.]|jgi:pyruvate dehydrogenase E1 component|nr:1-deoxy-D-xylulose-5-phosphate synthase N-terminal domain-containing protein [Candidatus Sulfotelmatobacter sp.]
MNAVATNRDETLVQIQQRALWLAVQMVYHANKTRTVEGVKVGGHMASSASTVTILTYLYCEFLRGGDKVAVKPHASPIYHALQYLLGNLDAKYLKELRAFKGLQSYPSRTKDPDHPDFSTGSMGLGASAANFAAMTEEYARMHFGPDAGRDRRYISLVGDAELDEGAVWEAIAEPALMDLKNILWVVDINRQSLDRVIPGIRVGCWREMFKANDWHVIEAKYGKQLQAAFQLPRGELLRECLDDLTNEAYQKLLRLAPERLREWLPRMSRYPKEMSALTGQWNDAELHALFLNLGGHDFAELRDAFTRADARSGPAVIFAYTQKGWMLPSVGHPQNHSLLLNTEQMEELRARLEISGEDIWEGFSPESEAGELCESAKHRLKTSPSVQNVAAGLKIPASLNANYAGSLSTQQIFGRILTTLARELPELSKRVVTCSPDVASSTNLGGWINAMGVWSRFEKQFLPEEAEAGVFSWKETTTGHHIELGISEINLFMALGQLGLSQEINGNLLFPIGTLYDCFVPRGLDAFSYGLYSGSKFIVVGTPSGITLAPEGGAHQSSITGSIGIELPGISAYEPCFGQELEWILMAGLENIRTRHDSTYLRLTSKPVDQSLLKVPVDAEAREKLRQQVIRGAYRLLDRSGEAGYQPGQNAVHIFAVGAMIPEALAASRLLLAEGIFANVFNVTGAGPLYREFQNARHAAISGTKPPFHLLEELIPASERQVPVVTVVDGHPHNLAWIGAALNAPACPLGVVGFGQSGTVSDLYREYKIDAASIRAACEQSLKKNPKTSQ